MSEGPAPSRGRRRGAVPVCGLALLGLGAGSCGSPADSTDAAAGASRSVPAAIARRLPDDLPPPREPPDNPTTDAKVELGRHLFYDPRLSVNGELACAGCHRQELAFTDGEARSRGATGELTQRNSMSLTNVAYATTLTWASPTLTRLEAQALVPLFSEHPVELGLTGHEAQVLGRFRGDPAYLERFRAAFPEQPDPVRMGNVSAALAAFQRTLLSFDSPYDRWLRGDDMALDEAALRGMALFFSEVTECFHCHGGFTFTDSLDHSGKSLQERPFHNTGLYNVDGQGAYPLRDQGLIEVTGRPEDMGRFRAPTLRNIAVTAPYMHDGSVETLEEAVEHYAAGGRSLDGPDGEVGDLSPLRSRFVQGFVLSEAERSDLLAFLHALTDRSFLEDPRLSDPFQEANE